MGRFTVELVRNAGDLEYAGGFARTRDPVANIYDDLGELIRERKPDVVVDFTTHPGSVDVAMQSIESGASPVVGASGWHAEEREHLADLARQRRIGAMIVPNFAIGAVLVMRFAQEAARHFAGVEIVEMHRAEKRDKPSGTALAIADRIASGGRSDVPIHSVRMTGLLAHHEVLFSNDGELLTLRHDSFSRESFGPGILASIRAVRGFDRLVVGLDEILSC